MEGISEVRSTSGSGASYVGVVFNLDRDIDVATQDLRDRVSAVVRNLPEETLPPVILKFNSDGAAAISIALSGNLSVRELTELADKIAKPRLERSAGVGEVQIVGGLERAINVWVDADRLAAYQDADHRDPDGARAPEPGRARRQRHRRGHASSCCGRRAG